MPHYRFFHPKPRTIDKPDPKRRSMLQARETREVLLSLFAICTLLVLGTVGYTEIEGWRLFDSLYMTVITLATIGYGETHPLSDTGRAFTMVLILLGVGVASVVIGTLARFAIQQQIRWIFERKGMHDQVDKLNNHTIFCGYGRLARMALTELRESDTALVIIDKDEVRLEAIHEAGFLSIRGDATTEEALLAAGIKRAKRIVSLLPKDADNLYVILTAKELNPNLYIISRADDENGEKRLTRAGADRIISPYRVGGQKIADGILRPFVTDFLDLAASSGHPELQIEEIRIPENSPLQGITLGNSAIRQRTNIMVAAFISADGRMQFNPSGEAMIEAGTTLIGLGYKKDFRELERMLLGS